MTGSEPEKIEKTIKKMVEITRQQNCRIVTLKRFIVAETILFSLLFVTFIYLWKYADVERGFQICLAYLALAGGVSTYYFKSLAEENKKV